MQLGFLGIIITCMWHASMRLRLLGVTIKCMWHASMQLRLLEMIITYMWHASMQYAITYMRAMPWLKVTGLWCMNSCGWHPGAPAAAQHYGIVSAGRDTESLTAGGPRWCRWTHMYLTLRPVRCPLWENKEPCIVVCAGAAAAARQDGVLLAGGDAQVPVPAVRRLAACADPAGPVRAQYRGAPAAHPGFCGRHHGSCALPGRAAGKQAVHRYPGREVAGAPPAFVVLLHSLVALASVAAIAAALQSCAVTATVAYIFLQSDCP